MSKYSLVLVLLMLIGCAPQEDIVFKKILNIRVEAISNSPVLKADLVFHNPNKKGSKLKKIDIDIFVNDKKGGEVDQTLNQKIKGESEFTVPIEVKLNLKEIGLLDTIINLFGGKKYSVRLVGKIRLTVNGFAISVPVDQTEELRIRM